MKNIVVKHNGKISSFAFRKLERASLYGSKKRIAVDTHGAQCTTGAMTREGDTILRSGMVVQGWFDDLNNQVEQSEIVPVDTDGVPLEIFPTTLGVEQIAEGPVDPREVLDLAVLSIYRIEPEEIAPDFQDALTQGDVFRVPFNYRADHKVETALLLANEHGIFALVGDIRPSDFIGPDTVLIQDETEDEEDSDDLDFQMM